LPDTDNEPEDIARDRETLPGSLASLDRDILLPGAAWLALLRR
jgi:hypothetical protein